MATGKQKELMLWKKAGFILLFSQNYGLIICFSTHKSKLKFQCCVSISRTQLNEQRKKESLSLDKIYKLEKYIQGK